MSLRTLAEQDMGVILEGDAYGFRWAVTITNPEGKKYPDGENDEPLYGLSTDISQVLDVDTGQLVSGRAASVSLRISTLFSLGFSDIPKGIADTSRKPWTVAFDDVNGNAHVFKVRQADPDRALGLVVCILEAYAP